MPSWEGIEDAATMLPRIWLTRAKETDVWKPLRKIDCKALNESRGRYHRLYHTQSMHDYFLYSLLVSTVLLNIPTDQSLYYHLRGRNINRRWQGNGRSKEFNNTL